MAIQELEPKFDMWSSIQESKKTTGGDMVAPPYVHPLVRRSISSLSPRSLEICTENLGSETGSDGYSDIDDFFSNSPATSDDSDNGAVEEGEDEIHGLEGIKEEKKKRRELEMVNYHCSIGRRSKVRSFPPPLPSISRRDGPCVNLRSHRKDGRLVVQAVPVPSQNYLHCHREDGRLLLTFIDTTFEEIYPQIEDPIPRQEEEDVKFEDEEEEEEEDDEEEEEEEEEEVKEEEEEEEVEEEEEEVEVEVVNRGIVVEVKMRKPKTPNRGGLKPHKSSLVINKFVSGTPIDNKIKEPNNSNLKNNEEDNNKLLFSSKKVMNREALLHQVRRCSFQQRPLFIWERCCVATS